MPRSVKHDLGDRELRVYFNHAQQRLIAIVEGVIEDAHDPIAVEVRWEIPDNAPRWFDLASQARDGDERAAKRLAHDMVREALEELTPIGGG